MRTIHLIVCVTMLAAPGLANAQYPGQQHGYTIITPGEPPTFVNPNFNGGYTAITPGESPTFIDRSFNGGYTVITPGQPPTFINPTSPLAPGTRAFGFRGNGVGDE